MLEVEEFDSYERWYSKLKDTKAKSIVLARIFQIQVREEYVGDCKAVGEGITELRIHFGPGYRVYTSIKDKKLLLLITGGTKKRQQNDIEKAKRLLKEWVESNEREDKRVEAGKQDTKRT